MAKRLRSNINNANCAHFLKNIGINTLQCGIDRCNNNDSNKIQ